MTCGDPICPFCNSETTYVVPSGNGYHCTCCGGDFNRDGEPANIYDDSYDMTECVMCGREGARERDDGRAYCSHCWTVWNS
jgi:transposase-like protein